MTTYTRVQRIQQTDAYKSGEWFKPTDVSAAARIPADDVRTLLAKNRDIFDYKRIQGKAMMYRKRKPITTLRFRKKVMPWEKEIIHPYSPRYC